MLLSIGKSRRRVSKYKNQIVDIAMMDGTTQPLKCRVYGGRTATHKPINSTNSDVQIVTDVPSGTMVAVFSKANKADATATEKASAFAIWLSEFMGDMDYRDLSKDQIEEIRGRL